MTQDLLRFTTAGSVDDGKSTLIGRLLYDSQAVYEDQVAAARRVTRAGSAGPLDFALLTDGLRAEREQGITIDVAYRYFSTPRRKFIIADAPGHEQYTRNMATAASNADLAVILIDARRGVLPQSRRHAYIASLLGIPRLIVAVNKMDQVDFSQAVYDSIRQEFADYAARLGSDVGCGEVEFIPLSALDGDNVVERSPRIPWYGGPSLLERLETVPLSEPGRGAGLRFPVQYVIRAGDFRGFAGRIAAGVLRPGDTVVALPSGRQTRIKSIVTWEGELQEAGAPLSVTVCLEDELDIGRGDLLISPDHRPSSSAAIEATLVWMNQKPLRPGRAYLLKHAATTARVRVDAAIHRIDMRTLQPAAAESLELNDIGRATLRLERPLAFDSYPENRATGSLILIDPITNETVAAGMIARAVKEPLETEAVKTAERELRNGHRAALILLPDENAAASLERALFQAGIYTVIVPSVSPDSRLVSSLLLLYEAGIAVLLSGPAPQALPDVYIIDLTNLVEMDMKFVLPRVLKQLAIQ